MTGEHRPQAQSGPISRRTPILYVTLAYAFTWAIWIPTLLIAAREGYALPTPHFA